MFKYNCGTIGRWNIEQIFEDNREIEFKTVPRWTTCWVGPGAVALGRGGRPFSSSPPQLGTPLHRGFLPPGGLLDLWAAQMGSPGASQQLPLPRRLGWSALAFPTPPCPPDGPGQPETHLPPRRQPGQSGEGHRPRRSH